MYSNKLAVAIKTAGKVLRESGDKVYLPFGSEYSIFIKNLNSVRALVRVSLDGNSVTDGEDLVVYGNSELNLERFLKKGNMESGNRFKFIERTSKVEAHRGIEAEDGLLRVEFQFEKIQPKPIVQEVIHKHYHDYYKYYPPYKPYWNDVYYGSCGGFVGSSHSGQLLGSSVNNLSVTNTSAMSGSITANAVGIPMNAGSGQASVNTTFTSTADSAPVGGSAVRSRKLTKSAAPVAEAQAFLNQVNDAGITVAGSVSDQKFQAAAWFPVDDEKFVIVLKLLGEAGGQVIEKPVLVRQKQTCSTCGTRNRGQNQFCRECGTALEIVGESPKRRIAAKR
jgi:hypothetical protein